MIRVDGERDDAADEGPQSQPAITIGHRHMLAGFEDERVFHTVITPHARATRLARDAATITSVKIYEYDLRLYGLLKRCLAGGYVSGAADPLTPAMRAGMLQSLPRTHLGELHGCGDKHCRSFKTTASPVVGERLFRVRFIVNGELSVTCGARGTLFRVEWLPGEPTHPPQRCYVATGDEFELVPHLD